MPDTIWGTTTKPVAAKKLAELIEADDRLRGTLYIGYPVLGTPTGAFPFDAIFLSPESGIIIFDLVEGQNVGDFRARQDDFFAKLQAKLLQYPALVSRRNLNVLMTTITFAPGVRTATALGDQEHAAFGREDDVAGYVYDLRWTNNSLFGELAGALQSLSTVRKGKRRRSIEKENSRGAKIRQLEESIANLDVDQGAAVIETVDGVQRIRGLAGSGKTIVLALKVAYLHAQHPDWRIAVTFNTRSLKGQFERLINTFTIEQTSEEPDWDQIEVMNAWGAPGPKERSGLYYKFCKAHGITYYDFRAARGRFGPDREFQGACIEALESTKEKIKPVYDAVLVDEAQDFPAEFLRLCYAFVKSPKRLVYAYDELQTLTNISLPAPEELFGKGADNEPLVTFRPPTSGEPRQDIILERCYRNSAFIDSLVAWYNFLTKINFGSMSGIVFTQALSKTINLFRSKEQVKRVLDFWNLIRRSTTFCFLRHSKVVKNKTPGSLKTSLRILKRTSCFLKILLLSTLTLSRLGPPLRQPVPSFSRARLIAH
jgi:superfamily I DNA and RNA helicase